MELFISFFFSFLLHLIYLNQKNICKISFLAQPLLCMYVGV